MQQNNRWYVHLFSGFSVKELYGLFQKNDGCEKPPIKPNPHLQRLDNTCLQVFFRLIPIMRTQKITPLVPCVKLAHSRFGTGGRLPENLSLPIYGLAAIPGDLAPVHLRLRVKSVMVNTSHTTG